MKAPRQPNMTTVHTLCQVTKRSNTHKLSLEMRRLPFINQDIILGSQTEQPMTIAFNKHRQCMRVQLPIANGRVTNSLHRSYNHLRIIKLCRGTLPKVSITPRNPQNLATSFASPQRRQLKMGAFQGTLAPNR